MSLYIQQKPTFTQDVGRIDNPRRFFILSQEAGRSRGETVWVMFCLQHHSTISDVIEPQLGDVRLVARVFLDQNLSTLGDGEIIHHLLALAAVEQHFNGAASHRVCGIDEVDAPQTTFASKAGRRDKIEVSRIFRVPRTIFGTIESRHAEGSRRVLTFGFEFRASLGRHVPEVVGGECYGSAQNRAIGLDIQSTDFDAKEASSSQTSCLNWAPSVFLGTDIEIYLPAWSVVHAGNNGIWPVAGFATEFS